MHKKHSISGVWFYPQFWTSLGVSEHRHLQVTGSSCTYFFKWSLLNFYPHAFFAHLSSEIVLFLTEVRCSILFKFR